MSLLKAYELEDAICEKLSTDVAFLAFCTSLVGKECKVIGGADFQTAEAKEDYPCIVVNVPRQTGDPVKDKSIDQAIQISILLNVSPERVQVNNYFKYADTPNAEKIASEIYKLILENYCGDTPPYYFEKDETLIAQGILRGSVEIIASQETYLGSELW